MTGGVLGAFEHRADAAGDRDVVVFDQHRVVEAEAVIVAAAAAYGVFLHRPQPRRGLARTDDARLGVGDPLDELRGGGGDAGHVADEVERGALGAEDRARVALNGHQLGAGRDRCAVARGCGYLHLRRQAAERSFDHGQAGNHSWLAGDNDGAAARLLWNRCNRGDVAGAPQILFKGAVHYRFDLKRGDESIGTEQRHEYEPIMTADRYGKPMRPQPGRPFVSGGQVFGWAIWSARSMLRLQ